MAYDAIAKPNAPASERLKQLSKDVRRIGCGYRTDPETIAIQKSDIATALTQLARELEATS
jgi:hypothetical protein